MLQLPVQSRQKLGKRAKQVRHEGNVPAILYGYGIPSRPVQVESRTFEKVWKEVGESSLVSLEFDDTTKQTVLIQDLNRDVLSGAPMHVDFYAVRMDRPIEADIPLVFTGEADAVRTLGGVLVKAIHSFDIRALPKDLPHEIEINISSLKTFDDQLFIKDITLPEGVEVLSDIEQVVTFVEPPRTEKELEEMEQPAEVSLENIEVAGEKEKTADEVSADDASVAVDKP
jgi:large subunit ribosomal protein L25